MLTWIWRFKVFTNPGAWLLVQLERKKTWIGAAKWFKIFLRGFPCQLVTVLWAAITTQTRKRKIPQLSANGKSLVKKTVLYLFFKLQSPFKPYLKISPIFLGQLLVLLKRSSSSLQNVKAESRFACLEKIDAGKKVQTGKRREARKGWQTMINQLSNTDKFK